MRIQWIRIQCALNPGPVWTGLKVKAIQGMKPPETKKEVRHFLGMIGYYRRFIPHFATKADPLTNLTKKGFPEMIEWNEELDRAFETLKQDLCQTVMQGCI